MLELCMAIQPRLVLETLWRTALSTFSHAPITTLEHARTSLYQQSFAGIGQTKSPCKTKIIHRLPAMALHARAN
jgi:hypothetical protein